MRASSRVNLCASPDSSVGRVRGAHDPVARRRERRLDRDRLVHALHRAVEAVLVHDRGAPTARSNSAASV
jgi:hypothetical protein